MYLKDLLDAMLRRWYLAVLGLLLTLVLGLFAFLSTSPTYTAVTSMFLIPPKNAVGLRGNPYLNLGGLGPARDVLAARVLSGATAQQIATEDPTAEIAVDPDALTTAPILVISVSARSAHASIQYRDRLAADVAPALAAMQEDLLVPMSSRIVVSTLATDPKPNKEIKNQLRSVILVVGVGCAVTVVGTSLIDSFLARRRSRLRTVFSSKETDEGNAVEDVALESEADTRILSYEQPDVEKLKDRDDDSDHNDHQPDPGAGRRTQAAGLRITRNGSRDGW